VKGKPKKSPREKDLTSRYLSGGLDEDRVDASQRFSAKNKNLQQNKTLKTAQMRQDARDAAPDIDALPVGQVVQVFSLFCEVIHEGVAYLCTTRKTLNKVSATGVVVGDRVRFRKSENQIHESGKPEGVLESVEPRKTVLTRADSFKQITQHPVVANADRMLIVCSPANPRVKWGLVDRMLVAARAGGLEPIVCMNKVDLATALPADADVDDHDDVIPDDVSELLDVDTPDDDGTPPPMEALAYYESLGVNVLRTSVVSQVGLNELRATLLGRVTVLAGHSGVGKSSLVRAVEPSLDIKVAEVSFVNDKGRHTTTSARHYPLTMGGAIIDTPGVKVFGLWKTTADTLLEHFPDVAAETAPEWRKASFVRIAETLAKQGHRS
jgi:ribosome biogenesis GTPase